jgi:hypothetical protein
VKNRLEELRKQRGIKQEDFHPFSFTGRAKPCSTYKNTQKSRRFKLKSGF